MLPIGLRIYVQLFGCANFLNNFFEMQFGTIIKSKASAGSRQVKMGLEYCFYSHLQIFREEIFADPELV